MFAKQAVREQRIPFEITRNSISVAPDAALKAASKKLIDQNTEAYGELAK